MKLQQLKIDAKNAGWPWPIDHPNDERALLDGCRPDFAAAEKVRGFFEDLLCVPDEERGGVKPFVLLKWWYRDVIAPLFGWKKPDGRRRFDKGFITTAKKTGKSTVLSGLPLYMMLADGEEEAECYSAAVDRDQASITYRKASRMVKESRELTSVLKRVDSQKRIVHHRTASFFEALSSDADSADGKNPHLLIVDELHRWKDRSFFNALMYGDIHRRQPMFLMITTAGDERLCVGFEEYEFAKRLLSGENYSRSHFAFISEASPDRAWDDPEGWIEANPSLKEGFSDIGKLQAKCEEARQIPTKQREFERFICNRWVDVADDLLLDVDAWKACGDLLPNHDGLSCSGGLDLSSVDDLTALCLAFQVGDFVDLRWWFWMPEENIRSREDRWRVPLRDWVRAGWIQATPGNAVDYAYIRAAISGVTLSAQGTPLSSNLDCLASQYDIQELRFDPWNASKLVSELGEYDGIAMVEMRQGFASMSAPTKELQRLVALRRIRHGGNPVATWMVEHAVPDIDPAGNAKPNKSKSRHKIDGIVAAVMAISGINAIGSSVYDTAGALGLN